MPSSPREFLKSGPVRAGGRVSQEQERWKGRIVQRQRQREAQVLLETLGKRGVLFYPGCGLDWTPLRLLRDVCDTFVYCDWSKEANDILEGGDFGGLACEYLVELDSDTLRDLSFNEVPHLPFTVTGQFADRVPWGKYVRLSNPLEPTAGPVHLFYLGIEGATLFFNLFNASNTVPKAICLLRSDGLTGDRATNRNWDGPLGELIQQCHQPPSHLIVCGQPLTGWPHRTLWRQFDDWEGRPTGYSL